MGASGSNPLATQLKDARRAEELAQQAAEKARTAATEAHVAVEEAKQSLAKVQSLISNRDEVVEERTAWWRSRKTQGHDGKLERLCKAQMETAEANAKALVAAHLATAEASAARANAAQASFAAEAIGRVASEAALEPLKVRLRAAEEKQTMWMLGSVGAFAGGVFLGGLIGASVSAASPGVACSRGTAAGLASDEDTGIVSAVAGLTWQLLSLPNVLTGVGSLAVTGVYVFLLLRVWAPLMSENMADETELRSASCVSAFLSAGYAFILLLAGDRLWSRHDDGSRILGGLLYCGNVVADTAVVACGLRVLGWRWLRGVAQLGSVGKQSLVDLDGAGPAPAVLIVAAAGFAASVLLYARSEFPLLLVPALWCLYSAWVAAAMILWRLLRLPRGASALLQPEVLTALGLAVILLICFTTNSAEQKLSRVVRLGLLISGMDVILVAFPLVILGLLDWFRPNELELASTSIYDPFKLGSKCMQLVWHVRETVDFAFAGAVYLAIWVSIMTTSVRQHLWSCRPFVIVSFNALSAVSPKRSVLWILMFRIPIGLWLLAVVLFLERDSRIADPLLQEVLRWLGPHPGHFLQLVHHFLQASTACTSMTCLGSSVAWASQEHGQRSWIRAIISWSLTLLALAARVDCHGQLLRFWLAFFALAFAFVGVKSLPRWRTAPPRFLVFLLVGRLCLLGKTSLLITVVSASCVCFMCVTLAFGEGQLTLAARRFILHGEDGAAERVSFGLRLSMSSLLFFLGVVNDEALLITLGCFCIYTSLASIVAGDDYLSMAVVVAACGVATMLLGEMAQTYMVPMRAALFSIGHGVSALEALLDEGPLIQAVADLPLDTGRYDKALGGLPVELWLLRQFLLKDLVRLVGGG
eukprot:TRINITY_DN31402_c0_g1_i1.p1 TRINITY_DN31402_c0_g1~~TRINITY_DN31402_c0_g1_i1.p1  ORF type:complete len:872 (-),score=111.11 TRINITY_DN31402_c0_g1_i1:14-2629(-)